MLLKFIMGATLGILLIGCGTKKKLQSAEAEIDQLKSQNLSLNNNLSDQAQTYENRIKSLSAEFDRYKQNCMETEQKLQVVNAVLVEEVNTLEKLEEKLEEALMDFNQQGVDVYSKNGLVYVSLADELLYKTGSATLGTSGKKALSSLSSVLNNYPNLKVIVLGNTDDVKFKNGRDNWTLSTERANGVVRVLTTEYNVDPKRLTAAGKGMFDPVADNTTPEGRAKNRRTDIVLNADLERLWNSIKSK